MIKVKTRIEGRMKRSPDDSRLWVKTRKSRNKREAPDD